MPSRSTSQLALVNQRQDDDLLYGVRDNGYGTWSDLALRVGDLAPEILRASVTIPTAEVLRLNSTPVTVLTGNPTAGDNDLNITLYYRLIDA